MSYHLIKVNVENREDGGVRVWSDDLPGLVLSGKDRIRVFAAIEPVARAILEHKEKDVSNLRIDATFISETKR